VKTIDTVKSSVTTYNCKKHNRLSEHFEAVLFFNHIFDISDIKLLHISVEVE